MVITIIRAMRTRAGTRIFAASALVTAALYVVPFGGTIAWPLVLISTLAHELGHGLAAALLRGQFHALYIYRDASGAALWSGAFGRVGVATVAAAGLIGPAIAAFVLLVLGREPRRARTLLGILGVSLTVIAILVVRNPFGLAFTLILAALLLLVAFRFPGASQSVVILLAVQLALSVFSRSDYLFTRTALTTAGPRPSDVAVMAQALFLPYWFWGAVCGVLSVAILWAGVKVFFR
jgi:peptidase M50B-like protein